MESKSLVNTLLKKCLAESFGTFMFCFLGAGAILTDALYGGLGNLGIALANGFALSVAISATLHISGAHINPVVTFLMFVLGRIDGRCAVAYVVCQLTAASFAMALLCLIFEGISGGIEVLSATGVGATVPGEGVTVIAAVLTEIVVTGVLVFTIFGTLVDSRTQKIGGFGIGLVVVAIILVCGPISGASMNPARSFGSAFVGGVWTSHWIYWTGPGVGALVAGLFYYRVILPAEDR